ncbi:trypsin-like serine peptidase [Streptomyces beihaiensis]|uniref:Serine protease n=1 Tax=Streptomyces beihaiensis TaxID=2984495 RepID=A0ABT3TUP6_9ACTN|nr:serine protease [Streptomyces beihaiensis]MCX3060241.1 serine protease [Streptomyces beihaiensis]
MKKSLFAVASGAVLLLGASTAPAMASDGHATNTPAASHAQRSHAQRHARPHVKAVDFAGTVALSNCSGSVIRVPESRPTDPALVMSNGHCLESGFPGPGDVVLDQPSSRTFSLLDASGDPVGRLKADKVAYGTMTDTDISLYELTSTYQQIEDTYGIKALELSPDHPAAGTAISVVSGYWKKTYSCSIDGFVYRLKEADWTWKDSVRYTPECDTIGGTSGSPVIDQATGKVIAVNNTGNEDGERCTLDNPCEVDENGDVTVHKGTNYAEETYEIVPCVGVGNKIDLTAPGCTLPKP